MPLLEYLAIAQVHVDSAGQARVEAAHRAHNVDAPEVVGAVLLEDRGARDRVLVWPGRPVIVGGRPVPRRGWVWVVVSDLAVPDHQVMRENPAYRLVKAAADRLVRHFELLEGLGLSRPHELEGLLQEVERRSRRVGYEVDPGPISLYGVGPLRDVPLELCLGHCTRLGQADLDAVAGGLDAASERRFDVHQPGERRGPEPG